MFKVKLLRSVNLGGRRALPGTEVQTDARTARELIETGTARLSNDADLPVLIAQLGAARPAPLVR